jgi:NhaA family Na+:H+ antiporter
MANKLSAINPTVRSFLMPFQEFAKAESSSGIVLILATVIALLWANSPWAESYHSLWATPVAIRVGTLAVDKPLLLWINDGLMAIFFFVVGLEIKRELIDGEFSSPKQALFPITAAIGGMVVPATLYIALNLGGPGERGWGIPMATDIAFALGVLSLLGRHASLSLKVFLTALAIVDDISAVLVIAFFYTDQLVIGSLALAGGVFVLLLLFNRLGFRQPIIYGVLGVVLWVAMLKSGVHATVAGVLLALTIPATRVIDREEFSRKVCHLIDRFNEEGTSKDNIFTTKKQRAILQAIENNINKIQAPLQRFEHFLHPWVAFAIMPVFALANAGVRIGGDFLAGLNNPVTIGIVVGLVFGKQIGIPLFSWLMTKVGVATKPAGVSWGEIYGVGWLAGIGFTMSLFITNLAFWDAELIASAKIGILLASLLSAIVGFVLLAFMRPMEAEPGEG